MFKFQPNNLIGIQAFRSHCKIYITTLPKVNILYGHDYKYREYHIQLIDIKLITCTDQKLISKHHESDSYHVVSVV